ncbi:hypothetical protein BGZ95_001366 [Linnemannia exigua]|uniref:Uncharacterized protein n=1 Tax=Linnemannia exigua TaxID=604196 RepID=A0AAD4DKJ8_9FUNG|nr:hypothetical protein BGZ95_001366 [Linnemannia exigua]
MNPATSRTPPTTVSSAFKSGGGVARNSSRQGNDSNPFLETPARKLFKHHHHDSSQSAATPTPLSVPFGRRHSGGTYAYPSGIASEAVMDAAGVRSSLSSTSTSRKPQRLVLTRVFPSNVTSTTTSPSPSLLSAATTLESGSSSATVATGGAGVESRVLSTTSSFEASYLNTTPTSTLFTTARPLTSTTTATSAMTMTQAKDSHGFVIPSAPTSRPSGQKQPFQQQLWQDQQQQHPSTTPTAPPNRHYFDFLAKSLESSPAPKLNLGIVSTEEHQQPQQAQGRETEQRQEPEQERPDETVPAVNSTMMALARKSIMQHSAVAPASIFRKLSSNRTGVPQSLGRSVMNNGSASSSSSVPQLSATTKPTPAATAATMTKSVPPHNSTAGESLVIETAEKESGSSWEPTGDLAFTFMSAPKATTTPAATITASTPAPRPIASEASAPSRVFARSVLDLSGSVEPKIPRKNVMSNITTTNTTSAPIATTVASINTHRSNNITKPIYPNKAHQPPSMTATLMNISSAAESMSPLTAINTVAAAADVEVDVEMGNARVEGSGSSQQPSPLFDIRAALRMDSARTQYQLPTLIASLSPPPSPRRRPTPYSIPSVNDREALRIRRMPRFKARPLNPHLFTGAGDQGLPKIQKPALTVPVSPVFSQRRRVKDAVAEGGLGKEKKGGGSDVSTSLAATRLKEMVEAGIAEKQRKKQQKISEQPQGGKRQFLAGNGAGAGNDGGGRQQTGGRIVSAARPLHARVPRRGIDNGSKGKGKDVDKQLGGIGGGARRIEVGGAGVGAASGGGLGAAAGHASSVKSVWSSSLIVPRVDQTRPDIELDVTSSLESHHRHQHLPSTSSSTLPMTAGAGLSKLRRPTAGGGAAMSTTTTTTTTRPVPFNFATTELQRKRMLYQPTPSDYALIAPPSSMEVRVGMEEYGRSQGRSQSNGSLNGGANGLSLQDLMPDV